MIVEFNEQLFLQKNRSNAVYEQKPIADNFLKMTQLDYMCFYSYTSDYINRRVFMPTIARTSCMARYLLKCTSFLLRKIK